MMAKVIQGSFLAGQPKVAPSLLPTKTAAAPAMPFAGRSPGVQPRALAARPPGPPKPAFFGHAATVQRHGAGGAFAVEAGPLGLANSGGRPLPDTVRGKMEAALGADFSSVRVHVGPQAERIGAIAFTVGSDIYFAPGRYQPETIQGQQLLGHELAHVVQQRAGRVRNPLGSGLAVVQDRALEAEADRLGQHAAAHRVAVQAKLARRSGQRFAPAGCFPQLKAPTSRMLLRAAQPKLPGFQTQPRKLAAPFLGRSSALQRAQEDDTREFTDEELREFIGDSSGVSALLPADQKRFRELLASDALQQKWNAALSSVDRSSALAKWQYNGSTYHLNIDHLTKEGSPKHHYYFDGTGMGITSRRPTKQEMGRAAKEGKHPFSDLPKDLQNFVKTYFAQLA